MSTARPLSSRPGNPAHSIASRYQELMAIQDPAQLRREALALATEGGISARNAARFRQAVSKATGLDQLQGFLTNFLLAADGLAVL